MTARIVWVLFILSSIGAVHAAPQRENTPPPPGTVIARSVDWEKVSAGGQDQPGGRNEKQPF